MSQIVEVGVTLSGIIKVEVPDDFDTKFDRQSDQDLEALAEYVDWYNVLNQLPAEFSDAELVRE